MGDLARGGLVGLALLLAAACGKKPGPGPGPGPAGTGGEKSEAPKRTESEKKKPAPALSDLKAVEGSGWEVAADAAEAVKGPFNLRDAIPFEGEVVVPSGPGPFVAVGVPRAKAENTYRVYDLRTMDAVGERMALPATGRLAVSPDGRYLAGRVSVKGKGGDVVEVWSTQTAKGAFRRDVAGDGVEPVDVDLPGGGRLWVAEPGKKALVWALPEGKALPAVESPPSPERRAFSPGGRYLVEVSKQGAVVTVTDLPGGKVVGRRRFDVPGELKGAPAAVAVSPDGEELAVLWRLEKPAGEEWGRLVCWEMKGGRKRHEHGVAGFETIDELWPAGKRVVQYWPGGRGWMLFGHLLVERETGAVVHRLGLPLGAGDLQDRRFLDGGHVTEARNRAPRRVRVVALPGKEVEEAVKEARTRGR